MRGLRLGRKTMSGARLGRVSSKVSGARAVAGSPSVPLDCVIQLQFSGVQTSGKNHQGRTREGRVYPTKHFAAWRDLFAGQFLMQKRPWNRYFPLQEPVVIWITYVPGDARIRDVPGMEDALWHLFEWLGCITNDRLLQGVMWRTSPINRETPGVAVEIFPAHWPWDCVRGPDAPVCLPAE